MPTDCLFREDAYLKDCERHRRRRSTDDGGIVLDRTVFYAASGGQPADRGVLVTQAGRPIAIANVGLHRSRQDRDRACAGAGRAAARGRRHRARPRSTGSCATPACACTPRCICSPPCCPIR